MPKKLDVFKFKVFFKTGYWLYTFTHRANWLECQVNGQDIGFIDLLNGQMHIDSAHKTIIETLAELIAIEDLAKF